MSAIPLRSAVFFLALAGVAAAQTNYGTITGTVQDPGTAVVPNAAVVATDVETVRAGFFNVFNRTVMPTPSAGNPLQTPTRNALGVATSGFGRINASSVSGQRNGQIVARVEWLGIPRFVAMQNHYNLIYREEEREMLPLCREKASA